MSHGNALHSTSLWYHRRRGPQQVQANFHTEGAEDPRRTTKLSRVAPSLGDLPRLIPALRAERHNHPYHIPGQ